MKRTARPSLTALLVATMAAVVAACSGPAGPEDPGGGSTAGPAVQEALPTPTPVATPAAEAAAQPLPALTTAELIEELPPLAREEDLLGAVAFSRHFFDLSAGALTSERTAAVLEHHSSPKCAACAQFIEHAALTRLNDLTYQGGAYLWGDIYDSPTGGQVDGELWWVSEQVTVTDSVVYSTDGAEVAAEPAKQATATMMMEFADGSWRMVDVLLEEDDQE